MSELITTLHPQDDNSVNLYPNVKLENIVDGKAEDAGKFVKVNEEGKFIVETVNIPEPQQVNNSTVTIKQGGVDKGSFTLNQAEDATIELDAGGAGGSNANSVYTVTQPLGKGIPEHKEAINPLADKDTLNKIYLNTEFNPTDILKSIDWCRSSYVDNWGPILDEAALSLVTPILGEELKIKDGNSLIDLQLNESAFLLVCCTGLKFNTAKNDDLDTWLNSLTLDSTNNYEFEILNNLGGALLKAVEDNSVRKLEVANLNSYDPDNPDKRYTYTTLYDSSIQRWSNVDNYGRFNFGERKYTTAILAAVGSNSYYDDLFKNTIDGKIIGYSEGSFSPRIIASKLGYNGGGSFVNTDPTDPNYALLVMNEIPEDGGPLASPIFMNKGNIELGFNNDDYRIVGGWSRDSLDTNIDSLYISDLFSPYISTLFSRDNQWKQVPATLNSIKESNVESKGKEVSIGDILVDTDNSRLAEVKKISDQIIITQTPVNPIMSSFDMSTSVENYVYIDTSIKPDFSSIDSSIISYSEGMGLIQLLGDVSGEVASLLVYRIDPKLSKTCISGIQFPFYILFGNNDVLYIQCEDIDINSIKNSAFFGSIVDNVLFNEWDKSHLIQDNGDIYKFKLNTAEEPGHAITAQVDTYFYDNWKSFISLDGLWKDRNENTVKVFEYDDLKSLNNSYDNLSDTPIINIYESWEDFKDKSEPAVYTNKYLCFKDKYEYEPGLIVFCDGENYYPITGKSNFSVNLTAQNGLFLSSTGGSDTSSYSATIGLTDTSSGTYTGDVDSTHTEVLTRHNPSSGTADSYTWRSIKAIQPEILAGNGISKSGNTVSLASDVRERLIPSTNGLDSLYRYHLVLPDSTKLSSIFWEKTKSTSIGTGLVEEPTNPSEQTLKIGLSSSDLDYTQPNTKVYAKNTDSNTFGWVSLPSQSGTSIQPGSGISVTGGADIKTISLTSDSVNRSISSANSGMYVMARDGSTMNQIGWSSVSIPRGVKAGTGLVSDTYDSYTDTLSLSQDVQNKLARIPDLPSADGNYALTCTISGGVPTFAWTLAN